MYLIIEYMYTQSTFFLLNPILKKDIVYYRYELQGSHDIKKFGVHCTTLPKTIYLQLTYECIKFAELKFLKKNLWAKSRPVIIDEN